MNDLIAEHLRIHYQDQILLVLTIFFLLNFIIQFISNIILSNKIEKFKNDLRKTEIKFSRHTDLQIECLKNLYDKVVTFHSAFYSLINSRVFTHRSYKSNILNFFKTYDDNMDYFHRSKILLTDEIISQIGILDTQMKIVRMKFQDEYDGLLEDENYSSDLQVFYGDYENEVSSIKQKIEEIKKVRVIMEFELEIKILREKVELYFKELIN